MEQPNVDNVGLRKSMNPYTLNMLLLLKANRSMWPDARTIQTVINDLSTEQRIDDESDSDDEF